MLLALDWAKVFDSIVGDRLFHFLRRIGVPEYLVGVISSIYKDRFFFVRIDGNDSGWKW